MAAFFLPVFFALVGAGVGWMLNPLAEAVHRQYPDTASIPERQRWLALATAVLFGLNGALFGPTLRGVLNCAYSAVLVLLAATDLEHRLIPNHIVVPAILFAGIAAFFVNWMTCKSAFLGGAVGLIFFAIAYGLAAVLYPGKIGLGMGDVTLATFIGLSVGFQSAFVFVVLGVLLGGVISAVLLVTRRVTLQTAIPYGPFLILGGLIAMLWGQAIVKWWLRM